MSGGRAFRLLLRLYPSGLRRAHGREMLELAEHYRARGLGWLAIKDVLWSLPVAHWRARRGKRRRAELFASMGKELVLAFRSLGRRPSMSALAVLTLALGIGATTAIFSVVNAVALRPLPYPEPERLVTVWRARRDGTGARGSLSQPDLRDIQSEVRSLEAVAAHSGSGFTLTGMGAAEVIQGTMVTDGLLQAFGLKPILGRDLDASENVPGGPRVAVIGYGFWQERLGGAPPLGKSLVLDAEPYEIVGVAPPGFDYPDGSRVYTPLYLDTEDCGRGCHMLRSVGRLRHGASLAEANEELALLASRLELEHGDTNTGKTFLGVALEEHLVGGNVKTALFVLLAAVGVVLLIACANVSHLLLARASERAGEMAVRSALGASGLRLLRQLCTEAMAMAAVATIAGWILAVWGVRFLLSLAPSTLPRLEEVSLDATVLGFALATALLVSLVFGIVPALELSRSSLASAMGHGGRALRRSTKFRDALLAGQIALSLSLLFASGLLLRSFAELRKTDLGFVKEDVLAFDLLLPEAKYPGTDDRLSAFDRIEGAIEGIPGVEAVGSVFGRPMGAQNVTTEIVPLDRPPALPGEELGARLRVVTPGYLATLGVPLVRGRGIEEGDRRDRQAIALVNESFARKIYPGKDPIGESLRISVSFGYPEEDPRTIIGIVGDFRSRSVAEPAEPEIYVPQSQMGSDYLTILVRAPQRAGDALLPELKRVIEAVDSDLPVRMVELLETAVDRSIGPTRFAFLLLSMFAGLAVLLAATGLYGVVSYLVSRRTKEIGIRMALGARSGTVLRMLFLEAIRPALLGVAMGLGAIVLESKALEALLYEVEPLDPTVLSAVVGLLLFVAALAIVAPACGALRISPAETLRTE